MPSNQQQALLDCNCGCGNIPCCPDRCCPPDTGTSTPGTGTDCTNPLPYALTVEITEAETGTDTDAPCFNMSGRLTLLDCASLTWAGKVTSSCTWCGVTWDMAYDLILTCGTPDGWLLAFQSSTPSSDCGFLPDDTILPQIGCDPIMMSGDVECFSCAEMNCLVPGTIPTGYPHNPFCISVLIYEEP